MCPTGYPKAMYSYKLRSVSCLIYDCAICKRYLAVIQRGVEEEADSTNQMSIFSERKKRVGEGLDELDRSGLMRSNRERERQ